MAIMFSNGYSKSHRYNHLFKVSYNEKRKILRYFEILGIESDLTRWGRAIWRPRNKGYFWLRSLAHRPSSGSCLPLVSEWVIGIDILGSLKNFQIGFLSCVVINQSSKMESYQFWVWHRAVGEGTAAGTACDQSTWRSYGIRGISSEEKHS